MSEYALKVKTPLGEWNLVANKKALLRIETRASEFSNAIEKKTEVLKLAKKQLNEYFKGKRRTFDLPLALEGTDFQLDVWKTLQKIPFGKSLNYQQIAQIINRPKASRAVGNAVGKNPFIVMVPCHRVLAKHGLGGFSSGISKKKKLLELESIRVPN